MTTNWTPADEDRKLNEYRRYYARQTNAELLRVRTLAEIGTGRDEKRALLAVTEELDRRGITA